MENTLNELKKNFAREYVNMTSTKDTLDIFEFCRNDNNQLREQLKDLHEILNGIVKALQNLHQNKQLASIHILQRKIPVRSPMNNNKRFFY